MGPPHGDPYLSLPPLPHDPLTPSVPTAARPPAAAPREVPLVAPPRRSRTKRPTAGPAAGSNSDLVCFKGGGRAGGGSSPTPFLPLTPPFLCLQSRSLSPPPSWSCPSHSAPASLGERGFFSVCPPPLGASGLGGGWKNPGCGGRGALRVLTGCALPPGLSRGPSPVVLGSQDALPVATAFTEYVHAYFKGRDADR